MKQRESTRALLTGRNLHTVLCLTSLCKQKLTTVHNLDDSNVHKRGYYLWLGLHELNVLLITSTHHPAPYTFTLYLSSNATVLHSHHACYRPLSSMLPQGHLHPRFTQVLMKEKIQQYLFCKFCLFRVLFFRITENYN